MSGLKLNNWYNNTFNKNLIFYIFLVAYAVFIVYLCYSLNIWIDEIYTLDTTSYNIKGVIKQSYDFEAQPPLYFALLSIWRNLNSSIFFARLFSAISVFSAAFVFSKLVKLISGKACSKWYIVLFLLNPFTVWAASEIRLYAFLLLLSFSSIYFFFRFYIENKNKYLVFFVLIGIAGIYTQYLYVFLLSSLGISVLIFKGWKLFLKFSLFLVPAVVLFFQSLLFTSNPMKLAYVASFNISFIDRLLGVFHAPQDLIMSAHQLPINRMLRWGVILTIIFLTLYAFSKWYKKNGIVNKLYIERINIILISASLLVLFVAVFFAYTGIDYTHRYLAIGFPFLISVFLLFDIFSISKKSIVFSGIVLVYTVCLISKYQSPVKDFDAKSLAGYLKNLENKEEPIMFYEKVMVLPLKYYFKENNPIIALPESVKFDSTYFSKFKDTVQLRQSLERINTPSRTYLLITNRNETHFINDADIKLLNNYLPEHYNITLDTLFYGLNKSYPLRIRRLEKK